MNSKPEVRPLEGKVAIVTGGVRRIGRAIALSLAGDGAAIVVNARQSAAEAKQVAAEIEQAGGRAITCLADVTDEAAVARLAQAALDRFGGIDILINNAAIRHHAAFTEIGLAEWRRILGVILDGAFLCARAVIPTMVAGGGGTIVNIGGLTAHTGVYHRAHVATAKAGLVGLTKALAIEFADKGITVNCVVPGKIGGARSATSGEGARSPGPDMPLVGRMGEPEDVAAMVRTLCLPTGRFVTGQTIHVSGGLYLP